MDKQILLGHSHSSKITTKDGKNYLVVGVSAIDKFRCRDLNAPGIYAAIHKADSYHIL